MYPVLYSFVELRLSVHPLFEFVVLDDKKHVGE